MAHDKSISTSMLHEIRREHALSATLGETMAEEPPAWPQIAGIDAAIAAGCLGADPRLFVSILPRLFREYVDLSMVPTKEPEEANRGSLAARLHKLRGSAGLVGATEVHRLATELEEAVRTPGSQVLSGLKSLADSLAALRDAAEPTLATEAARWAATLACNDVTPLSAAQREELLGLLQSRNLEALDRLELLKPALALAMGVPAFERFEQALQALDFEQALRVFEASTPT